MPRLHQQHERVLSKIIGRLLSQPASECRKSDTVQTAPSDEGAVSEADWGREIVNILCCM